jgi:hypothetical protein
MQGLRSPERTIGAICTAFVFTYGLQVVHLSRDFILLVLLIGSRQLAL